MTDSARLKELADWRQVAHPSIFEWTMANGKVMVLLARVRMPDKIRAERLAKTFRRRGVEVSRIWEVLTVSACSIDLFMGALTAAGFDWETFSGWVAFLHFDGTDYHTDERPPLPEYGPQLPIFFCRWHNDIKGRLDDDNAVTAANAQAAAHKFWECNQRNHPLPQLVDVIDAKQTYQSTFRLEKKITVEPIRASVLQRS